MEFHPTLIEAYQGVTGSYVLYENGKKYYMVERGNFWFIYINYDPCYWYQDLALVDKEADAQVTKCSAKEMLQEMQDILVDPLSTSKKGVEICKVIVPLLQSKIRATKLDKLGI